MKQQAILTAQEDAQHIAALAAWVQTETSFLGMLIEAGCSDRQAQICMQEEN